MTGLAGHLVSLDCGICHVVCTYKNDHSGDNLLEHFLLISYIANRAVENRDKKEKTACKIICGAQRPLLRD